jgi:hypothetical protein
MDSVKRTQLQRQVRDAFQALLPSWLKYRKGGLYRRTEDFVQWLYFDIVEYRIAIRPYFSVQALAAQIPAAAFTLGSEIRSSAGLSTWIEPENWTQERDQILRYVIQQVNPKTAKPLTTELILSYLESLDDNHYCIPIAQGIASIVLGHNEVGRAFFKDARERLMHNSDPAPWVLVEKARIERWLSHGPVTIISALREDAKEGARIVGIKE